MTQAELEAQKNTLLASAQPITATIHRTWAQKIIDELYNVVSRGKVLATTSTVLNLATGDKVMLVRGADTKLIDKDVFVTAGSPIQRWDFSAHGGVYPTDPKKIYWVTDDSVLPANTQLFSKTDTLPPIPSIDNFYTK